MSARVYRFRPRKDAFKRLRRAGLPSAAAIRFESHDIRADRDLAPRTDLRGLVSQLFSEELKRGLERMHEDLPPGAAITVLIPKRKTRS